MYSATAISRSLRPRQGPVDNAIAWCGLWGISQTTPTAPRTNDVAPPLVSWSAERDPDDGTRRIVCDATDLTPPGAPVGGLHVGPLIAGWLYAPAWTAPITPGRLRSLLARPETAILAAADVNDRVMPLDVRQARIGLHRLGIEAVLRFPVLRERTGRYPARYAGEGVPVAATAPAHV